MMFVEWAWIYVFQIMMGMIWWGRKKKLLLSKFLITENKIMVLLGYDSVRVLGIITLSLEQLYK
jgi:hypothetical protein